MYIKLLIGFLLACSLSAGCAELLIALDPILPGDQDPDDIGDDTLGATSQTTKQSVTNTPVGRTENTPIQEAVKLLTFCENKQFTQASQLFAEGINIYYDAAALELYDNQGYPHRVETIERVFQGMKLGTVADFGEEGEGLEQIRAVMPRLSAEMRIAALLFDVKWESSQKDHNGSTDRYSQEFIGVILEDKRWKVFGYRSTPAIRPFDNPPIIRQQPPPELFIGPGYPATSKVAAQCLGSSVFSWSAEDQKAHDYSIAGSDYRTFIPKASLQEDNSLFVFFKCEHIRGGFLQKDDYAIVELVFNNDQGTTLRSARVKIVYAGVPQFDTGIIRDAALVASGDAGTAAIAAMGGAIINSLLAAIDSWSDYGGREVFKSVIQHNINCISKQVL